MKQQNLSLKFSQTGQSLPELGLLIALITLFCLFSLQVLGTEIRKPFEFLGNYFQGLEF